MFARCFANIEIGMESVNNDKLFVLSLTTLYSRFKINENMAEINLACTKCHRRLNLLLTAEIFG
jgi:hypothetical protein